MKTKIKCPNCQTKEPTTFSAPQDYAKHIREFHQDDPTAMEWANTILADPPKETTQKTTYMGKPLDRIPPNRVKNLPKSLRKQLKTQLETPQNEQPKEKKGSKLGKIYLILGLTFGVSGIADLTVVGRLGFFLIFTMCLCPVFILLALRRRRKCQ